MYCVLDIFTLMPKLQIKLNMPQFKLFMIFLPKLPLAFPISAYYTSFSQFLGPNTFAIIFGSILSFLPHNESSSKSYWLDYKIYLEFYHISLYLQLPVCLKVPLSFSSHWSLCFLSWCCW